MTKRPRHNPTKCTPEAIETIMDAIREGNTYADAAAKAGVCRRTFNGWRVRAERELERVAQTPGATVYKRERPYVDFYHQLEEARLEGKMRLVKTVYSGGLEDPRVALEILRRQYPTEWGTKADRESTPALSGILRVEVVYVDE